MKKGFCYLFCITTLAIAVFAQTRPTREADWQILAPKGEEFSTQVPVAMEIKPAGSSIRYSGKLNGTYFFIFSEAANQPRYIKGALDFVHSQQQTGQPEAYGNIAAEKFEFQDVDGYTHRAFTFRTKQRTYLIHAVSEERNDPLVARFFEKLVIGKPNLADPNTAPASGGTAGLSMGIATIQGGNQPDRMLQVKKDDTPTTPLKVISKPRPSYTEAARVYFVSGNVALKVTFSADGTIGEVTPVTKLPFGLTQSSITAARAIKFEPATRAGNPVDSVKVVEYTFDIY